MRRNRFPSHVALDQAKLGERCAHGGRHSAVQFGAIRIEIPWSIAFRQIAPPLKRTPRLRLGRNKDRVKLDAAAQDAIGSPHLPQANDMLPRPDETADHPVERGLRPDTLPARRLSRDVDEILPRGRVDSAANRPSPRRSRSQRKVSRCARSWLLISSQPRRNREDAKNFPRQRQYAPWKAPPHMPRAPTGLFADEAY